MRGIFSKLPADTLAAALAPIADQCEQLDWAVEFQSGPLRYPYSDEDDPRNLWSYHREQDGLSMGWFIRGFLPRYADCLIMGEWSYCLGFDSKALAPAELACRVGGLHPRSRLLQIVAEYSLFYMLRADTGWWEAYSPDPDLLDRLRRDWDGIWVDSDRWDASNPTHPGDPAAT